MQDRRYLLSIAELLSPEEPGVLWEQCFHWLDAERQERVKQLQGQNKRAESMGAGLLLQLAVCQAITAKEHVAETPQEEIIRLTVIQTLKLLEQAAQNPLSLEYRYGEKGKPYFKDYPYYFNLSHSNEYIFLVISQQEVGADIQWRKPLANTKVAQRFFSEVEKKELESCQSSQEMLHRFYGFWTRKEAYGKLTGEGIAAVVGVDMQAEQVSFEEYEIENYQIAVCKWK